MSRNRTTDAETRAIAAPSQATFQLELPLQAKARHSAVVLVFQKPEPVKSDAAALRRILDFAEKLPGRNR